MTSLLDLDFSPRLLETAISKNAIRMRYSAGDPPTQWLDFQTPLRALKGLSGKPLDDPETMNLLEVQASALREVRRAIDLEIQRLAGRTR